MVGVLAKWVFDEHGRMRAAMRAVPGVLVEIVITRWGDEREGKTPGTFIRTGIANGGRLAVLFWPGDPIVVHSVWWVTP